MSSRGNSSQRRRRREARAAEKAARGGPRMGEYVHGERHRVWPEWVYDAGTGGFVRF